MDRHRIRAAGVAEQPRPKLVARFGAAIIAAVLFGCAAQPDEESSASRCPAFTRPDTVHQDGLTVRACSDRHGNIVCVESGGRLHCRTDDGASLISTGDD